MKFIFLLGGTTGFGVTAAASWYAGNSADRILLDAAVGCLAAALLFRWFWNVLVQGMRETIQQKQAAFAAATAAPAPAAGRPATKQK